MVILRPTAKLRSSLPVDGSGQVASDTALGDWVVNRIVVDRRPLLLLVSSRGLLPMVVPARGVRGLPGLLPGLVAERLRRLRIPEHWITAETRVMDSVAVAPTVDRSILGILVEFGKQIPFLLDKGAWDESCLARVEDRLAETPCFVARRFEEVVFPERDVPRLLEKRWGTT